MVGREVGEGKGFCGVREGEVVRGEGVMGEEVGRGRRWYRV
jgi:hypothetical protein